MSVLSEMSSTVNPNIDVEILHWQQEAVESIDVGSFADRL
jgi:hypothetical protein